MRIGIKSGTFTILHPGHIWMFDYCKQYCDYLIVLTNSDNYIQKKKGVVPIDLSGRLFILGSIKAIDRVGWFEEDTEDKWIEKFYHTSPLFRPEEDRLIVFHSIETKGKPHIPAADLADEIIYVPRIEGSTTEIFDLIRSANGTR